MRQTKQSSNNPTKKKGPVEPRTFSKAGHRWRAGDCMWLDTLEEMCAKNYYQLFKNIHFLTTN